MSTLENKIYSLQRQVDRNSRRESHGDLGDVWASYMFLHELRAFWAFGSMDEGANAYDSSGQNRTLINANGVGRAGYPIPVAVFPGANQYYRRSDEAALSLSAGGQAFTIGGWFRYDTAGANIMAICKDGAIGNFSYHIQKLSNGSFRFQVSSNGTATTYVDSNATSINQWYFVVGRFLPTGEMKLWVNKDTYTNTTSIPSSVYDSTSDFALGAWPGGGPARYWDGYMALCFVCQAYQMDESISRLFNASRWIFSV
jgi:hypothetical protein